VVPSGDTEAKVKAIQWGMHGEMVAVAWGKLTQTGAYLSGRATVRRLRTAARRASSMAVAPQWILAVATSSCDKGLERGVGVVRPGQVNGGGAVELTEKVESGGDQFGKCSKGSSGVVTGTG
jgi:hypothetical protein